MEPRIIVLEDNDGIRQSLTMLLKKYGYEVVAASEPTICPIYSTAEESCSHEDACGDFLLTDNQMPNMTGLDFIEAQSQRGCKGVIANKAVMSGSWSVEDRERAERFGCKILNKPFHIKEIIEWLEERKTLLSPDRKLAILSPQPAPSSLKARGDDNSLPVSQKWSNLIPIKGLT